MNPSTYLQTLAIKMRGPIPMRSLGKTGLNVSIIGLGGESLIKIKNKETEAIELIETAFESGINYFDTAPSYEYSEERLGKALSGVRERAIIATKTEDRTKDGSWRLLEQSLKRLKTNYIDIWQIHHIDDSKEVKTVLGPDGALSALKEAKKQGLVHHIGITGHYDPKPLKDAIKEVKFDTILLSLNAADPHRRSFIKNVLPEASKQNLGIVAMKVFCRGRIFDPTHLNNPSDALNYVLSLPISTAIIGHDNLRQLFENIKIMQDFRPLNRNQMDDCENLTKDYADLALFFRKDNEKLNPFWKPFGWEDEKEDKNIKNTKRK